MQDLSIGVSKNIHRMRTISESLKLIKSTDPESSIESPRLRLCLQLNYTLLI